MTGINSNYIYDINGKTIGIKANTDEGQKIKDSGFVVKDANAIEWITLDDNTDINNGFKINELDVTVIIAQFVKGNLSPEELNNWILANGAVGSVTHNGDSYTAKFTYQGKEYSIECSVEKAKYQTDSICEGKGPFTEEVMKDGGFTSDYWVQQCFTKNADGTYSLKQPLVIEGIDIHDVQDLRSVLNLQTYDEYIESNFSDKTGSLWDMHFFAKSKEDTGDKTYAYGSGNSFYNNLAIALDSNSNTGSIYYKEGQSNGAGFQFHDALAKLLLDGGYIKKKDYKDYTIAELRSAAEKYFADLAQKSGKSVNELTTQDFVFECSETIPAAKESMELCLKKCNIDYSMAGGSVMGYWQSLFGSIGYSDRYPLSDSSEKENVVGYIHSALTSFIYDLEPENNSNGYFMIKDALFRAAGIDDDADNIDSKAQKMNALLNKIANASGISNIQHLTGYDVYEYLYTHKDSDGKPFVWEDSYTLDELKNTCGYTDDEINRYFYEENGRYKTRRGADTQSNTNEACTYRNKMDKILYGIQDTWEYYSKNFNGDKNEYKQWMQEHNWFTYEDIQNGKCTEKEYYNSIEKFLIETQPTCRYVQSVLSKKQYDEDHADWKDALFEQILKNFENFNVDGDESLKSDEMGNGEYLTADWFSEHAIELQRLSEEEQNALIQRCLQKLLTQSANIRYVDNLASLITAMGGEVTNRFKGYDGRSKGFITPARLVFVLNGEKYDIILQPYNMGKDFKQSTNLNTEVYNEYVEFLKVQGKNEDEIQEILSRNHLTGTNEQSQTTYRGFTDIVTPGFVEFLKQKYNLSQEEIEQLFYVASFVVHANGETEVIQYRTADSSVLIGQSETRPMSLQDVIYYLEHRETSGVEQPTANESVIEPETDGDEGTPPPADDDNDDSEIPPPTQSAPARRTSPEIPFRNAGGRVISGVEIRNFDENRVIINDIQVDTLSKPDESKEPEGTEPEELITTEDYKQEAKDNVDELQGKVENVINDHGTFYNILNGKRYNYVWDPFERKWLTFDLTEITSKTANDNTDKLLTRIKIILAALKLGLTFTVNPRICKDKDGNYYDYDESDGTFKKRNK